jgi:hypothetical protein
VSTHKNVSCLPRSCTKWNTAHRLRIVFKQAHGILNDDFVFEPDQLNDFLRDPGTDYLQFYFSHIDLCIRHVKKSILWLHGKQGTFLSNSGGNFMDLRSLSSLSEKRRSCSADVPLKNPEWLHHIESQ